MEIGVLKKEFEAWECESCDRKLREKGLMVCF